MHESEQRISEVTRRAVFDHLMLENLRWAGRMEEDEFLARLYPLDKMPSTDPRYRSARQDIYQHRVRNPEDWDDHWILSDRRFKLLRCADAAFLRFLCETIHPVVQPDEEVVAKFLDIYNSELVNDGFEITETTRISGHPVFAARETLPAMPALDAAKEIGASLTGEYLNQQITRMEAAIWDDPELAIGTAKELIETWCKTILQERGATCDDKWDVPRLVHATLKELRLAPESVPREEAAASIRKTLGNLAQLAQGAAELRNLFGTGHGKEAGTPPVEPRHARLAAHAASTLVVFLFETHGAERARTDGDP